MASSQSKKTTTKAKAVDSAETAALPERWQDLLARLSAGLAESAEITAFVQQALRESYLETANSLLDYAQKVRFYNALKKRIRELLKEVRHHRASLDLPADFTSWEQIPIKPYPTVIFDTFPRFDEDGNAELKVIDGDPVETLGDLEAYMERLEELLQTVGDDAQLTQIDLQNWVQKVQQSIQAMSNLSKATHDALMAAIRNMKG